ncbi:hypothetical protein K3718_10815 [Leisingera aquaemixtae]|uniref:Uncharacterized protein n=1 Tax=Leisingera aquaemixtae TaxID=1396826 RepID=A0ABY5WF18_9RHOB|nr:hypothetical protein [Leisingera aquaemixtae]UWQ40064.1 hypothetical protein K3718_10815 [Leisingera aquaemixtae]
MPTAEQLAKEGQLQIWPTRLALGAEVTRIIYIGPNAGEWIHANLKALKADGYFEGVEQPREQLADVFRRVMTGEKINDFRPKTLWEHPEWIHELRTADLRIFGWFWRKNHFIVGEVGTKSDLAAGKVSYSGYLESCRAFRKTLDLEEPKFIEGDIDDIL